MTKINLVFEFHNLVFEYLIQTRLKFIKTGILIWGIFDSTKKRVSFVIKKKFKDKTQ